MKILVISDVHANIYALNAVLEKEADADHFWSLEQNGEMLMTGASSTPISDGEAFDFVYTALN